MASFIFVQNLRVVLEHKLFHNWFVIRPTTPNAVNGKWLTIIYIWIYHFFNQLHPVMLM